jgi:hypothetical protein
MTVARPDAWEFQSTPGQLAGRCRGAMRQAGSQLFQSTPGQLAGRCLQTVQIRSGVAMIEFQSTPGQLAGRCATAIPIRGRRGFNPRPANWPGDACKRAATHRATRVSIRARPIGRAMLRACNR